MNATQAFLGDPDEWTHIRVELRDVHGLWGGRNCYVAGSGRVVVQLLPVPQHEERFVLSVPLTEIIQLLIAAIEADLVTITFPLRLITPDEACPVITLVNAAGEARRVHKWAGDAHPGFERVYQLLLGLAERARQGDRLYQGPFDPHFVPA
jgi:hypothetical protein